MKMKCQHCGRKYIVFNSTAIVKGAFCCLACELAWKQSRKGYPGQIRKWSRINDATPILPLNFLINEEKWKLCILGST